jgi:hypothetical protein
MTRSGALLAALTVELLVSRAQAEDASESQSTAIPAAPVSVRAAPPPPKGDLVALEQQPKAELLIDVKLEGSDPDARYEVRAVENDAVLLSCQRSCSFRIWPGRYRLLTRSAEGRVVGDHAVELDRDTRIDVSLPSTFELVLGGVVTTVAVVAAVAGVVLYRNAPCASACSHDEAARNEAGLGLMLGGAVTLPLGLVLLESGWSSDVSQTPTALAKPASLGSTSVLPFRGLRWAIAF